MANKCVIIKRNSKIIDTNNPLKNISIRKEVHDKIKKVSVEARTPIREITETLLLFGLENLEIKEEK